MQNFQMSNQDVRLYYAGTFLPVVCERSDSGVATLMIEDIRYQTNTPASYLDANITGRIYFRQNGENQSSAVTCLLSDCLGDGFTTAHRNIGYVKINDRLRWLTFRRQRTNRKGLGSDRVAMYSTQVRNAQGFNLDESLLCALYSTFEGRLSDDFAINGTRLEYKAVNVGTVRNHRGNKVFTLEPRFTYLSSFLQRIDQAFTVNVGADE